MHFSFQLGLSIADLTRADEHARVVFSPKKTESLYKLSAATDAGSFLAYSSVSASAYHASISSSNVTSVIMNASAGKRCSTKSD
jgi:hypothetical protein